METKESTLSRRRLMQLAGAAAATSIASPVKAFQSSVSPPLPAAEVAMQEHGVLGRVLLICDELARQLVAGETRILETVVKSTDIIRKYFQGQHERVEELLIFPALTRADSQMELISVLVAQHKIGADLMRNTIRYANADAFKSRRRRIHLSRLLTAFSRMYRPHALREDTVIYPALRRLLQPREYHELSERVQDLESKMTNQITLESILKDVQEMEEQLSVYDLTRFQPHQSLTAQPEQSSAPL